MSSFWKVMVSIVATFVIVGGGTFYLMEKQIDSVRSDNQSRMDDLNKQIAGLKSTTATPAATTTPATTDATAGWKTYTNAGLGFTFKYPSTMTVTDTLSPDSSKSANNKILLKEGTTTLEVYVNPDGFGPFLNDNYYKLERSGNNLTISERQKNEEGGTSDGINWTYANLKDAQGNILYMFHYKFAESGSGSTTTFDKILSTFQFTK